MNNQDNDDVNVSTHANEQVKAIAQTQNVNSKVWWKSKTVWINGATTVVGIAMLVAPDLQTLLTPQAFGVTMIVIGIVNKVLRYLTNTAIQGSIGETKAKNI